MLLILFFSACSTFTGTSVDAQQAENSNALDDLKLKQLQKSFQEFRPDEYRRPYGRNAPWNIPVKQLARHPESDYYVKLLWRDRLWPDAEARHQDLTFKLTLENYTYPVFYASDATGEFKVDNRCAGNQKGSHLPWNPQWAPATGSDAQVILLDERTGREWNMWQVKINKERGTIQASRCNLVQSTVTAGDGKRPGDYRTKENGFRASRGIGVQYLAMLVRPEEIMQGVIAHALSMPVRNPSGDFSVPPATKVEHPGDRSGVPEGMRFALDVTDAEIEAWVSNLPDSLPFATRYSARIIATALRDYGWFVTDTSGRAHLQFEDRSSAGPKWELLGLHNIPSSPDSRLSVPRYPDNLLDGLVTQDRIYAIVPSDRYQQFD